MKPIFKDGFCTLDFGSYERHFLCEADLIAFLSGTNLLIQQN